MKSKNHFFVVYPRDGQGETMAIMKIIEKRLNINYDLWSYSDVKDETDYYQEVVEPAVQEADFVLAFVGKQSEEDYLLTETIRLCNNLNKSMVPVKLGSGRIKDKNWGFRTKVVDFYDESQRITLIEQLHGWLGLTKIGDVYGSNVVINTSVPGSIVSRDNEVMGKTNAKGQLDCVLAKGSKVITIETNGGWNSYRYNIPNNDSDVQFEASLSGLRELQKTYVSDWLFDPSTDKTPDWDLTNRLDFQLVGSSEDKKKKGAIYHSYNNYYRSHLVPYPEFHPREIEHSKGLLIAVWIVSIVLIYFAFGTGLLVLGSFFFIRRLRGKAIMRQNERRKRELIEGTDSKNHALWYETNRKMNKDLDIYRLSEVTLPNLGTPRDYLLPLVVEE